jgi:hypothetical protein
MPRAIEVFTPNSVPTFTYVERATHKLDVTVHGFRSTFRDWAAESTAYPNHVVEQALADTLMGPNLNTLGGAARPA